MSPRVLLYHDANRPWRRFQTSHEPWLEKPGYPARWIHHPGVTAEPAFTRFELVWNSKKTESLLFHVSADERYQLLLNGRPLGEGPERSHLHHWKFESYQVKLAKGTHRLEALVWSLGAARPWAQTSIRHGFLLWPEATDLIPRFATGTAPWRSQSLPGFHILPVDPELHCEPGGGPGMGLDGAPKLRGSTRSAINGLPARSSTERLYPGRNEHALEPAELPAQQTGVLEKATAHIVMDSPGRKAWQKNFPPPHDPASRSVWERLWSLGNHLRLPPNRTLEVVWDLGHYQCGYPHITLDALKSSGARIEFLVVEAPFDGPEGFMEKSRRDEVGARFFRGLTDRFEPAASAGELQKFRPLWWRAGRFLLLRIHTGSYGLLIHRLGWETTGYPLRPSLPKVSDSSLQKILTTSLRTLERCSHETYMDCPHYEQLMYAGDGRIEALLTYCSSADTRLARKALRLFDQSRANPRGLPTDAVPGPHKMIPPFALWWISMIHDYALWHGEPAFIRTLLPGARHVADQFLASVDEKGIAHQLEGWNFYDWCWPGGIPPGGKAGEACSLLQWQLILVLGQLEELESWIGQPERARVWRSHTDNLIRGSRAFWSAGRGLYADTPRGRTFSQHPQSLALLSGHVPTSKRKSLLQALEDPRPGVTRAGGYFTHYVFAALLQHGRTAAFFKGLQPWRDALAQGFTTFPETFGATRSDCHAWNAHPLYHVITELAGLRPERLGGRHWIFDPQPGPLQRIALRIPRDGGSLSVKIKTTAGERLAQLTIPSHLEVRVRQKGKVRVLEKGTHALRFPELP
ncbi:MAG: hypothetical protein SFU85_12900 [Candidatus Methylacidiphilales bacterium]|nr:hypothetical protein [Candidatus Methylacidiphilales bacterium]